MWDNFLDVEIYVIIILRSLVEFDVLENQAVANTITKCISNYHKLGNYLRTENVDKLD